MKKMIVCMMMLLCLLVAGGCLESLALIGSGAAGGMTLTRILDQQQKVIREDIEMMEAQKADLEQQLAEATEEVEKEKIRQQIKNTETVLMDLKDADEAISRAKEGLGVNWQDPQSVIPFAGAVLMTAFGIWQRRKKKQTQTALAEVVNGGQIFKRTAKDNTAALAAFKEAQTEAQKTTKTKELVAVLRV